MASSLRMAAPKMASMAAQSTTKVARPAQYTKSARAYQTGKLSIELEALEELEGQLH